MTTEETLNALRDQDQIIWENHRYAATYAVDRPELTRRLQTEIPVLHLGQVPAIDATRTATPGVRWLTIELRCRRDLAEQRLTARDPADVADRLKVWDETPQLRSQGLRLDTGLLTPAEAVAHILSLLR